MPNKPRLPGGQALALWFTAATTAHVVLPVALARGGCRRGWLDNRPGATNKLGLIPLGLGSIALAWCYASHRTDAPAEGVRISLTPEYLVASGPYRFSRNPMYVAEQSMWLGWSVYFGNAGLLAATGLLAAGMNVAVRREERTLNSQFGPAWKDYSDRVPRWL